MQERRDDSIIDGRTQLRVMIIHIGDIGLFGVGEGKMITAVR